MQLIPQVSTGRRTNLIPNDFYALTKHNRAGGEPELVELFRQRFIREARDGTYVMHFAGSGEQALELLAGEIEPTLIVILSDINMPGMDGLQLLGKIKQRRPDLPVMMVTAYGDDERKRRAQELGAFEFITKPLDFDFLKEQLRQLKSPSV